MSEIVQMELFVIIVLAQSHCAQEFEHTDFIQTVDHTILCALFLLDIVTTAHSSYLQYKLQFGRAGFENMPEQTSIE